jgi:hypothetical protein
MAFLRHFSSKSGVARIQWHCYVVTQLENTSSETETDIIIGHEGLHLLFSISGRMVDCFGLLVELLHPNPMVYPYQSAKPPRIELAVIDVLELWLTGKYSRRKKLQKRGRLGVGILPNLQQHYVVARHRK